MKLHPTKCGGQHLPSHVRQLFVCLSMVFAVLAPSVGCNNTESTDPPATVAQPAGGTAVSTSDLQTAGSPPKSEAWFENVTAQSQIDFVHQRGPQRYWIPEITGGGGGWIDFDADGDPDLYLVQGGDLAGDGEAGAAATNALYENLGDGTFRDVTKAAGVGDTGYGMGLAVGDYNADGFLDLYVTNVGPNVLYRNRGDGTFEDVTDTAQAAGRGGWTSSVAFVDYDQDGDLDLFMTNYLDWSPDIEKPCTNGAKKRDYCAPTGYQTPSVDTLLRNEGDGTFVDVSQAAGLSAASGNGLGVAVGDFDRDGRLDFYVANDGNPNQLWLQKKVGEFTDRALLSGCAVNRVGAAEAGMGVAPVDIDNDGDLDLFMTHLVDESNTLYLNRNGFFEDATAVCGLSGPSINSTGFGMGFVDFDHDGELDLFVANGRVTHALEPLSNDDVFAEPNQVFRGLGQGKFEEITAIVPNQLATSRAAAFADFNSDGTVDVMIVNSGGRVQLLANRCGKAQTSVRVRVLNEDGTDAIGASVALTTREGTADLGAQNHKQHRTVQRTYSFLASNEPVVHFGVPTKWQPESLEVTWPDGHRQMVTEIERGTTLRVRYLPY